MNQQIKTIERDRLKEAIITARVRYVTRHPFWGMIGLRAPIIENPDIKTAGTDGRNIYYNPEWLMAQYSDDRSAAAVIQFVIAHEIYHILLRTVARCGGRNKELWNIASDYIINRDLKEEFNTMPVDGLYHSDFDDPKEWYAEKVYEWIESNHVKNPGGKGFNGQDRVTITMPKGDQVDAEPWDSDEITLYPGACKADAEEEQHKWKALAVRAYQVAQRQGSGHGYLTRLIEEILAPRLPWRALLSDFVSTFARDDYSYDRLDPTYMQSDILMPSLFNMTLNGVIAVDTSGSITLKQAQEFISEIAGITSAFPGSELTILFADDSVHNEQKIFNMAELDLTEGFKEGGGGTAFEPTFEYLKDKGIEPTFFTYLTDGYGSYPNSAPSFSSLWVINNESCPDSNIPFGRIIRMVD